jgi:ATP synthase protein I
MASNEEGALWSIFGYLISGLVIWGGIGFGLDKWLHTHFFLLGGLVFWAQLVQFRPIPKRALTR